MRLATDSQAYRDGWDRVFGLKLREWVYIQRPKDYGVSGCACGNEDPDWSEFKGRLWCQTCRVDFIPQHNGVFDGPILVNVSHLMGLCFSRYIIATQEIEKDECCKEREMAA